MVKIEKLKIGQYFVTSVRLIIDEDKSEGKD